MSFGYAIGDFILLSQLAYRTVRNARRACGAHDELTREVNNLHIVLQRLERELAKPESLLNREEDNRQGDIATLAQGCENTLGTLCRTLEKYNALPEDRKRITKLLQKIKFGNGEMLDLGEVRLQLATHTNSATLFINLLMLGSQGRVEQHMDNHSEELSRIRQSLNWISASLHASTKEGTVWTVYSDDDKTVWRKFRGELVKRGFNSKTIKRHKTIIIEYLTELGSRGAFDHFGDEETISQEMSAEAGKPPKPTQKTMDFLWSPTIAELQEEEDSTPRQEATPADALEHSIDQYSYCLKHWDPRETPIRFVGSIFDMYSLCDWTYENAHSYDKLRVYRLPTGSQPKYIANHIEELRGSLKCFRKAINVTHTALLHTGGVPKMTLENFIKDSEEVPKLFQKFVDEGELKMLRAKMNRKLGENLEAAKSSPPRRLSEVEWNGRNAIESVWKTQPIETFGKRAGLDFVQNLSPEKNHICHHAYSLSLLIHKLKKVNRTFKQKCEQLCTTTQQPNDDSGINAGEPGLEQESSSSSTPSPPLASPQPSTASTKTSSAETVDADDDLGDSWRDSLIRVMGKAPIEIGTLETFLRARGIGEAELEGEIVKLIVDTQALYPEGGQLAS